jgi:hypothetical protein
MACVHRHILRVGFLLAAFTAAACGTQSPDVNRTKVDTRFEENRSLFAAIRDAGDLTLYEGLPHQFYEPQQLEEEKQQKSTVTLHGFPFYAAPLDVGTEDAAKITGLLADERSFLQWRGEKKCGGFHPDYLAEYRVGESTYRFLICLGCHEIMAFGPDHSLRCDFQGEAYKLEALLKKYHKSRPALQPR